MRILHLGVYNRNVGDNVALLNARKSIERIADVEWVTLDMADCWNTVSIDSLVHLIKNKARKCKFILVGGGGLIEGPGYSYTATGYKLPFTKHILKEIEVPVIFYGVGFNEFRGREEFNETATKHLKETIDNCLLFSVRNDGSKEKLLSYVNADPDKIKTIPDPGLLYLESLKIGQKIRIDSMAIQPAWNGKAVLNENRFGDSISLTNFKNFFADYPSIPHTLKDFKHFKPIVSESDFREDYQKLHNTYKFLEYYKKYDSVVSLRGHGQLITIGANIPGIYLSTQDKVRDFSYNNGFRAYNVDVRDENWISKVEYKISKLKTDYQYLEEWYDIRDRGMRKWTEMNNDFIELIENELYNM